MLVKSYGCQMNVYDAGRMVDALAAQGYAQTESAEEADLVVLNTCAIREKASEKVFSELGRLRETKLLRAGQGRATTIAVAGCVAQAEGVELIRRQRAVDLVIGPQNTHRLIELLARSKQAPVVDTEFPVEEKFDHLVAPSAAMIRSRGPSAFVTVQEGCDKFCSFCVVPYTRGAEYSRSLDSVLAEVERLADSGVREIVLLGQNVNAYHGRSGEGTEGLAALITRVARVPGVARIRYTTSHPNDFGDDLIAAHAEVEALAPCVHLPVQAGADRILNLMNRKHSADDYRRLVDRLRAARPDLALSSDFIVGFPGESEAEFEATLALVRDVGFASAYSFKYSTRPGTPAADRADQIAEAAKTERLARLQALLESQRQAFNRATVGARLPVLFERTGRHGGQMQGKSPYLQQVYAEGGPELIGAVRMVEILEAGPNALRARLVERGS